VVLFKLKRYDEAIRYFDKIIEMDSNYAKVWNNKGAALGSLGRFDDAEACFDKAIA
jgi:tetratricopeptide (TPR) repeat protein